MSLMNIGSCLPMRYSHEVKPWLFFVMAVGIGLSDTIRGI